MDDDNDTMLHEAASFGLVDSVQQLIKAGGRKLLFATSKDRLSALHYATVHASVKVARLLIEAGGKSYFFL